MAEKSDGGWIVWAFLAGLGLMWAYEAWGDQDELPKPPPPLYSSRPVGMIKLGEDLDGTIRSLNADTVAGDWKSRRGWIISDHSKDKTIPQRQTKELIVANCDEGSYTIPSYIMYDKDRKVMFSWDESEDDKARIYHAVPGSIGETNFNAVCRHIFDPIPVAPPIPRK